METSTGLLGRQVSLSVTFSILYLQPKPAVFISNIQEILLSTNSCWSQADFNFDRVSRQISHMLLFGIHSPRRELATCSTAMKGDILVFNRLSSASDLSSFWVRKTLIPVAKPCQRYCCMHTSFTKAWGLIPIGSKDLTFLVHMIKHSKISTFSIVILRVARHLLRYYSIWIIFGEDWRLTGLLREKLI